MKKLLVIALLFAACRSNDHNGFYVNHTDGQYAITDDTLEVKDSTLVSRSGFQKIRNGQRQPKAYKTQTLFGLHPVFEGKHLLLNGTTYQKIN